MKVVKKTAEELRQSLSERGSKGGASKSKKKLEAVINNLSVANKRKAAIFEAARKAKK